MKQEQENKDTQNVVPLSSDEIKSILKSQSESIFEDKNLSNNSNFLKKSLIEIALDFESNQKINEEEVTNSKTSDTLNNSQEEIDGTSDEKKIEEVKSEENKESKNKTDEQFEAEQPNNQEEINNTDQFNGDKVEEDIQSENLEKDENFLDNESNTPKQQNETIVETRSDEIIKADDETQQALDSVRDAVSQSMNKNKDEGNKSLEDNKLSENVSETLLRDYDNFQNILSSLSTLSEKALYEVFENKILEISYDLAGYQIDKMPEKYEKKIKSFLKNINCYQDKITVEINDKDFEALSKIKNFNKIEYQNIFISNKELSRGDIILNCDGMRYSEKSNYSD
jgi:hypothetical protein